MIIRLICGRQPSHIHCSHHGIVVVLSCPLRENRWQASDLKLNNNKSISISWRLPKVESSLFRFNLQMITFNVIAVFYRASKWRKPIISLFCITFWFVIDLMSFYYLFLVFVVVFIINFFDCFCCCFSFFFLVSFIILQMRKDINDSINSGTYTSTAENITIKSTHFVYKQNNSQSHYMICVFYITHYCSVWQLRIQQFCILLHHL